MGLVGDFVCSVYGKDLVILRSGGFIAQSQFRVVNGGTSGEWRFVVLLIVAMCDLKKSLLRFKLIDF